MKWDWELTKDKWLIDTFLKQAQGVELPNVASQDNINLASQLAQALKQQLSPTAKPNAPLTGKIEEHLSNTTNEAPHATPLSSAPVSQKGIPQSSNLINQIAELTPFNSNQLDFGEIQQFLKLYGQLEEGNSMVQSTVARVNNDIASLKDKMTAYSDNISLNNINPTTLSQMTNQPFPVAITFNDIILNATNLYRQFATHYQKELQDSGNLRRVIQQSQDGGPAIDNVNRLTQLLERVKEQVRRPH